MSDANLDDRIIWNSAEPRRRDRRTGRWVVGNLAIGSAFIFVSAIVFGFV
ncbi:hypothetical protein KYK29_08125 [Shinella daejeonensis]|nr:hypothetical protein [Shinella daejeonensis]MCP8894894.1 hypothetical protein [Shinella daejeonensis]